MKSNSVPIRILAVFANPIGTNELTLGQEDKVMRECIKRSRYRQRIDLSTQHATTIDDLARALLEEKCRILHVSGHGTERGLVLEDPSGKPCIPKPKALADTFRAHSPPLECVILNSCFSVTQGYLTALGVPYTIVMAQSISDEAAIEFTRGFYDAVGAGRDIPFAFEEGIRRMLLHRFDTLHLPILLRQDEVANLPRESLPILLDNGEGVFPQDIAAEGPCTCERPACVEHGAKLYCYWPKWLSPWVMGKRLYWRCYDELVMCPRCGHEHKRGHVGKTGECRGPYLNQESQSDTT